MALPNANPPGLPADILRQILGYNELWQGQRGRNALNNGLSPALTRAYMMSRATLDPPLPWKPSAADRRNALQAAQNQRTHLQTTYLGTPMSHLASPLALALITEEAEPPIDLVRPWRKDVLVFDDLKSMSGWFSTGGGGPAVIGGAHPNLYVDVLNPNPNERIPWIRSVRIVQVTFIDNARYSPRQQPSSGRMEYAQEAFAGLANAMGRMALEHLHIIVPGGVRVLMSIDDPGVWEISHIRGLIGFDVQADQWSVDLGVIRQLKSICQGQRVRWQPFGMAYQPIWRPPFNIYARPPNTRYDWRQLLRPTVMRSLHQVQHDWLDNTYRSLHGRQENQLRTSRLLKRRRLRQLRRAWANLDALLVRGQNTLTARGTIDFTVEIQLLQNLEDQALHDYTTADNALGTLRATPAPAVVRARRQLNQQITTATTRRRTAQRALREANRATTDLTQGGFNAWPRLVNLRTEKDNAQRAYQYARKERRAVRRSKDAEVIRNIRRATNGDGPFPRLANRQTNPGGLLDEAGDLMTRRLRDISPNESEIDPNQDYQ